MRITLFAVGRLKAGHEAEIAGRYLDRLSKAGPSIGLEFVRTIEVPESRAKTPEVRKRDEAGELEKCIPAGAALIVLDERGKDPDSERFAGYMARLRDEGRRDLVLAIGGADGFDQSVRKRADMVMSFGKMTWPHQLVRIMLAEQLYRATTILSGHPYHRP